MNYDLIQKELARAEAILPTLEIGTDKYERTLFALERLDRIISYRMDADIPDGVLTIGKNSSVKFMVDEDQTPGQTTIAEACEKYAREIAHDRDDNIEKERNRPKEEAPVWEESNPYPETTEPVELTREYVRSKLEDASGRGIVIQPIIAQFVPEGKPVKFSQIPESDWPKLLEVLANAG